MKKYLVFWLFLVVLLNGCIGNQEKTAVDLSKCEGIQDQTLKTIVITQLLKMREIRRYVII